MATKKRSSKAEKYFSTFNKWEKEYHEKLGKQDVDIKRRIVELWAINEDGEDVKKELDYWYKRYAQKYPKKSVKTIKDEMYAMQLNAVFGI